MAICGQVGEAEKSVAQVELHGQSGTNGEKQNSRMTPSGESNSDKKIEEKPKLKPAATKTPEARAIKKQSQSKRGKTPVSRN